MKHSIIALFALCVSFVVSSQTVDSVNAIGVINMSTLRGTDYQVFTSKKKNASDVPKITLLGYYNPGDGGGGVFYWSDTSTVTDDSAIYIKPASVSGAGRWKRFMPFDNQVNAQWFGLKAENTSFDNYHGWLRMYNYLLSVRKQATEGFNPIGILGTIYFPANTKEYYFSQTLVLKQGVKIIGDFSSPSYSGTKFRFPPFTTGIRTEAVTDGETIVNSGVYFKGLHLLGNATSFDSTQYHGFDLDVLFHMEDCLVQGFSGNGYNLSAPRPDSAYGNVDFSMMERCWARENYNGLFIRGGDGNQMTFIDCNFFINRRWGVWDKSFLGNAFFGCHTATNAILAGQKSMAIYDSVVYYAKQNGLLPLPTSPGWEAYWGVFGATTAPDDYNASKQYEVGGGYFLDGASQGTTLYNCYAEGDQAPNIVDQYSLVVSGNLSNGFVGAVPFIKGQNGRIHIPQTMSIGGNGTAETMQLGVGNNKMTLRFLENPTAGGMDITYDSTGRKGVFAENYTGTSHSFLTGGNMNPGDLNRTSVIPGVFINQSGAYFGQLNSLPTIKFMGMSGVAPGSLAWDLGDIIWRTAFGPNDNVLGWRCVSAGTPGTWEEISSAASGTYTPSLTNTTNVSSSTASVLQYMRVGNVITVSGDVQIDPTSAGTTELRLSLPIASSFNATTQGGGSAMTDLSVDNGKITAVPGSGVVSIKFVASDLSNKTYSIHFTYQVL